ncbi:hypothetical protein ACQKIE_01205 [Luteibacter sp. NPDC031894]|uniref:hypothetical protein n=1 Tax=Luteibacter sp. NPDC031894 TaxID=3390572 RepID=UPI003CFD85E2
MHVQGSIAFNFLPDGTIVEEGDHSPAVSDGINIPFGALGVHVSHAGTGDYRIDGPGLSWPAGWKITIFKDENDENTVRVSLSVEAGALRIQCVDPGSHEATDIVYMMTVRVGIHADIDYVPPTPPPMPEGVAPPIGEPAEFAPVAIA